MSWYRKALTHPPIIDPMFGYEPNADNTDNQMDPPVETPLEISVQNLKDENKPGKIQYQDRTLEGRLAPAREGGEDPHDPGTPLGIDEPDYDPNIPMPITEMNQSTSIQSNFGRGIPQGRGQFPPQNWSSTMKYNKG